MDEKLVLENSCAAAFFTHSNTAYLFEGSKVSISSDWERSIKWTLNLRKGVQELRIECRTMAVRIRDNYVGNENAVVVAFYFRIKR